MDTIIKISNGLVRRGSHTILQIPQLSIEQSECVALIGPNGAGKTTLLKLCGGLIRPSRGHVQLGSRLNRTKIGYIPQQAEYSAHLPFTVREVVAMGRNTPANLFRRLTKTDHEIADFWLSEMGLTDRQNQTFRSLSGGQQQKALIARAMTAEPKLLLLDEPGSNLDPGWKSQLKNILNQLYDKYRMTILLISHELNLIPACCRRLIFLDRGTIFTDGNRQQVLETEPACRLFGLPLSQETN